ncbi:hypothetical protein THOM_2108, partial [Trachipleistophora hominis]
VLEDTMPGIKDALPINGQSESADRHSRLRYDTRAELKLLVLPKNVWW